LPLARLRDSEGSEGTPEGRFAISARSIEVSGDVPKSERPLLQAERQLEAASGHRTGPGTTTSPRPIRSFRSRHHNLRSVGRLEYKTKVGRCSRWSTTFSGLQLIHHVSSPSSAARKAARGQAAVVETRWPWPMRYRAGFGQKPRPGRGPRFGFGFEVGFVRAIELRSVKTTRKLVSAARSTRLVDRLQLLRDSPVGGTFSSF